MYLFYFCLVGEKTERKEREKSSSRDKKNKLLFSSTFSSIPVLNFSLFPFFPPILANRNLVW